MLQACFAVALAFGQTPDIIMTGPDPDLPGQDPQAVEHLRWLGLGPEPIPGEPDRLRVLVPDGIEQKKWESALPCLKKLHGLAELDLIGVTFTKVGLPGLETLSSLRVVWFTVSDVDADGLNRLAALPKLQELRLRAIGVDLDRALASRVRRLKALRELRVDAIAPDAVALLKGHRHLARVEVQSKRLDDATLTAFADAGLLHLLSVATTNSEDRPKKDEDVRELNLFLTPITDKALGELGELTNLERIGLGETKITDAGCARLQCLTSLREVWLSGTSIGDKGLEYLTRLPKLQGLGVGKTKITDKGAVHLKKMRGLRELWLNETKVGDSTLEAVATLPELRELELRDTKITRWGLRSLTRLSKLRLLNVTVPDVDDDMLRTLVETKLLLAWEQVTDSEGNRPKNFESITWLDLRGTSVGGAGLRALAPLRKLERIRLTQERVTDDVVRTLFEMDKFHMLGLVYGHDGSMPTSRDEVETADLSRTKITDESLKYLARLPVLVRLELPSGITAKGLKRVRGLESLETLRLSGSLDDDMLAALLEMGLLHIWKGAILEDGAAPADSAIAGLILGENLISAAPATVTDSGLKHLKKLPRLRHLCLYKQKVTDSGMAALAQLPTLESLSLGAESVTGSGLRHLRNLPRFRELKLYMPKVGDEDMKTLSEYKGLTRIDLESTRVTAKGVATLLRCPSLTELKLPRIDDEVVRVLSDSNKLHLLAEATDDKGKRAKNVGEIRCLRLTDAVMTAKGLRCFRTCTGLRSLDLDGRAFSLELIEHLARTNPLREIYVENASGLEKELAELRKRLPKCRIVSVMYDRILGGIE